jgi:hypothetical protein
LQFSSVHLIKFCAARQFCANKPAHLVAAKRYVQPYDDQHSYINRQKTKDNFHNIIKDNCDKCHSTSKWMPSTFDHSVYFILDQNHNTTCNTCHSNNNYNSFTCYGCHEHSESKIIAEHNEEGIYNISNCISCHKSGNEHDIKNNNKSLNEKERNKIKDFIKSNDKKENDDD